VKIHPGLIGFDIDGVVADTMEAFIRLARDDYGINSISPEDITDFEVEDCLDMESSVVNEIFIRLMEEPVASGLRPMNHAVTVLLEFSKFGPLTFVTARPQKAPIEKWLKKNLYPASDKIRLTAVGEHDNKADAIEDMGLEYFVDDRAETCIYLQDKGIVPFVYSQPWNRGRHDLQTVGNWLEIRALSFH